VPAPVGWAAVCSPINAPSPHDPSGGGSLWDMPYPQPVDHAQATAFTAGAIGRAHALAAASDGAVRVATDIAALDRCRAEGALAMVLHLEGAEAIDVGLSALDAWHAAGVRSLGLVWSRPSAFGHGVPFRFPASPDTGPGLTPAGLALVRRCAERGILVDVSHLNAAGFADVARLAAAPVVASHSACHALCPATRNLTDDQLREVGRSDGIVGIVFATAFVRADGAKDETTPLSTLVAHVRHAVEVAGIDHVGLGSDFDGAPMPAALADVAALPRLLGALRDDGFGADELQRIAWGNWRRVLAAAWGD
jgi:membrane dipeptidase